MSEENFTSEQVNEQTVFDPSTFNETAESTIESKPAEETSKDESISGIPEKFKSIEDYNKSYSELERRNTELSQKLKDMSEGTEDKSADESTSESSMDFNKYSQEIMESGSLSEESLKEITDKGIPKEIVEAYVDSQNQKAESIRNEFYSIAGDEAKYAELSKWAANNISQDKLAAYDNALNTNIEAAKAMLTQFNAAYVEANGTQGSRIQGVPDGNTGEVFTSRGQVNDAMNDPRYGLWDSSKRDPAYAKSVDEKLQRSKF